MDAAKNIKRVIHNISPKTNRGGIYIYYSYQRKVKRFPTGIRISVKEWDSKNHKPRRGALRVGDETVVDNIYNRLLSLINQHQHEFHGKLPPINYLEAGLNKPEPITDVHKLFAEFIEERKRNNRVVEHTTEYYEFAGKLMLEVDKHYNYFLNLDNFNYDFVEKYIDYCLNEKGNASSTINQRIEVFVTFVKWLDRKQIKHNINPETWEKLDKVKADTLCLERNELNEILEYQPKTKREERTKDIIVFLSHTGMRQIDAKNLTKDYIINDCLEFYPQKTIRKNIKVVIPISKPVREVLRKYNNTVPVYSPKYLSDYIREFCANIPPLKKEIIYKGGKVRKCDALTSHSIGRKTFINLVIQEGVPLPVLMGFTGHTHIDTVLKSYVDKHINNLPQLSKVFEFEDEE